MPREHLDCEPTALAPSAVTSQASLSVAFLIPGTSYAHQLAASCSEALSSFDHGDWPTVTLHLPAQHIGPSMPCVQEAVHTWHPDAASIADQVPAPRVGWAAGPPSASGRGV